MHKTNTTDIVINNAGKKLGAKPNIVVKLESVLVTLIPNPINVTLLPLPVIENKSKINDPQNKITHTMIENDKNLKYFLFILFPFLKNK